MADLTCLVQDEENLQRAHNEVPSNAELNRRLARSPDELATFQAIDSEMDDASTPLGTAGLHAFAETAMIVCPHLQAVG